MEKFHGTEIQKTEAIDIFEKIKDKSSLINRSRPQSVACGVVRYYINQKNKEISMEYFQSRVGLSEITIQRLVTEIERIFSVDK
jgi:hypothetical protein